MVARTPLSYIPGRGLGNAVRAILFQRNITCKDLLVSVVEEGDSRADRRTIHAQTIDEFDEAMRRGEIDPITEHPRLVVYNERLFEHIADDAYRLRNPATESHAVLYTFDLEVN